MRICMQIGNRALNLHVHVHGHESMTYVYMSLLSREGELLTVNTHIRMYTLKHIQVYGTSDKNTDRPR